MDIFKYFNTSEKIKIQVKNWYKLFWFSLMYYSECFLFTNIAGFIYGSPGCFFETATLNSLRHHSVTASHLRSRSKVNVTKSDLQQPPEQEGRS